MKHILHAVTAAAALLVAPLSAWAAPAGFGQPLLIIDGPGTSGSLLNFFDFGLPSDLEDLSLSGTVSQAIGAPSLVGADFSFSSSEVLDNGELTLGSTTLTEAGFTLIRGPGLFDPFQGGPGDLNISALIMPPFFEPVFGTFDYQGDFDEYPTRTAPLPEFEILISVYLAGPLPTETFNDPIFGTFEYFAGTLDIDRIEILTAGGAPLPAVPLPATGLLLLAGLGALGLRARRRAC